MTPQELKNSILQLAMQGKLVAQNSSDIPACEVIEPIKQFQQNLITRKTIKKEKFNADIVSDCNDLPAGWCLVKIGQLTSVVTKQTGFDYSKTIKPNLVEHPSEDTIPLVQTKNFKGKNFDLDTDYYIPIEIAEQFPKILLDGKCMLLSIVGASIGNVGIYELDSLAMIGGAICKVKMLDDSFYDYLYYFLQSPIGQNEIKKNLKATAQGTITVQDVREIIVPMPPLEEQKRIVAKIEELLPYIDKYEKAWTKLEAFNKKFPDDMQKSILQMAIQGKLVEQRVDEGTAEELYKQIQEEKQKLIKEGKIKKQKALPEIAEDEIPFDIPDSWKWVRLVDVVYNHGQEKPTEEFSYIDIRSIDNTHQKLNENENIISADKAPSRARKLVKFGDIIYSTVRPYLHNMCIIDKEFSRKPIASTGFAVMACHSGVTNRYLFNYLLSPAFDSYANATENSKGVAYPAINDDRLYRALVPLPPLEEQERIVEKIEELLPLCNMLK